MTTEKRTTTIYTVNFKGLFGRNRQEKSHWSSKQVEGPTTFLTNESFLHLVDSMINVETEIIKPKRGVFKVIKYDDCEVNDDGEGHVTYTIPITKPIVVYTREIS